MPDLDIEIQFSANRLRGERLPHDLRLLLAHRQELAERTGVELSAESDWAPWLDTSYLSAEDLANPDIIANVRAIADVCNLSAFVAAHEDREYFGYWRGPALLPVHESLVMWLDNEGQFAFCGTQNLAGAILTYTRGDDQFEELREWFEALGIGSLPSGPYDLGDPEFQPSPSALHRQRYRSYLGASGAA